MFAPYLSRWQLIPDGDPIHTHSSDLLPVQYRHIEGLMLPAMLKVARTPEEEAGNSLMVWLGGDGAAQVYEHDGPATLLERLNTQPSLAQMALNGQDDEATRILCRAAMYLHSRPSDFASLPYSTPNHPTLTPLAQWFGALQRAAGAGGLLATAWDTAQHLLSRPQENAVLHGDIHHGNVLHSPQRGWLLIDPKGLVGERGYDYANLFCNPNMTLAHQPGRMQRQLALAAQTAGLEPHRLAQWVLAYAGLSAAWWLEDKETEEAARVLELARLAHRFI